MVNFYPFLITIDIWPIGNNWAGTSLTLSSPIKAAINQKQGGGRGASRSPRSFGSMYSSRKKAAVVYEHRLNKKQMHDMLEEAKLYMTGMHLVQWDWRHAIPILEELMKDSGDIDMRAQWYLDACFLRRNSHKVMVNLSTPHRCIPEDNPHRNAHIMATMVERLCDIVNHNDLIITVRDRSLLAFLHSANSRAGNDVVMREGWGYDEMNSAVARLCKACSEHLEKLQNPDNNSNEEEDHADAKQPTTTEFFELLFMWHRLLFNVDDYCNDAAKARLMKSVFKDHVRLLVQRPEDCLSRVQLSAPTRSLLHMTAGLSEADSYWPVIVREAANGNVFARVMECFPNEAEWQALPYVHNFENVSVDIDKFEKLAIEGLDTAAHWMWSKVAEQSNLDASARKSLVLLSLLEKGVCTSHSRAQVWMVGGASLALHKKWVCDAPSFSPPSHTHLPPPFFLLLLRAGGGWDCDHDRLHWPTCISWKWKRRKRGKRQTQTRKTTTMVMRSNID